MAAHEMVFVSVDIISETDKGLLITATGDTEEFWLPKSQIDYDGSPGDTNVLLELPEWLAEDKNLI